MAKTVRLIATTYSDAAYVEGVAKHDSIMERELYLHCRKYFFESYRSVFFCSEDNAQDIFQDAFITLWTKIENRKIYAEDGVLKNVCGTPFTSSLQTYFMSLAKFKFMEFARNNTLCLELDEEENRMKELLQDTVEDSPMSEWLYDDPSNTMLETIAQCISVMSPRCNEILTKFYYEEKSLDDILTELPSFTNKDALKTQKYKCMETLRTNAQAIYKRYING